MIASGVCCPDTVQPPNAHGCCETPDAESKKRRKRDISESASSSFRRGGVGVASHPITGNSLSPPAVSSRYPNHNNYDGGRCGSSPYGSFERVALSNIDLPARIDWLECLLNQLKLENYELRRRVDQLEHQSNNVTLPHATSHQNNAEDNAAHTEAPSHHPSCHQHTSFIPIQTQKQSKDNNHISYR